MSPHLHRSGQVILKSISALRASNHGSMMSSLSATPPNAEITGALRIPAPTEVRWALICLWLSLTISLASVAFLLRGVFGNQSMSVYFLIVSLMPFVWGIFSAFLNVMIAYKKNWARIAQLVITIAILAYEIAYWPAPTGTFAIKVVVVHGLDWIAMYLLFLTSGSQWFRKTKSSNEQA